MGEAEDKKHSIVGGWLGTYTYRDHVQMPVRFEATFTAGSGIGAFAGSILDDGPLGEAIVSHGLQAGRHVRFRKTYTRPVGGRPLAPVHCVGTLSEDGRWVTGTWELKTRHTGRVVHTRGQWEARRIWGTEQEQESEPEGEEATAERELALPGMSGGGT